MKDQWSGKTVLLSAKSHKGKNTLREEFGRTTDTTWLAVKCWDRVYFDPRPGPWLFVVPIGKVGGHDRWVHANDDQNFCVATGPLHPTGDSKNG